MAKAKKRAAKKSAKKTTKKRASKKAPRKRAKPKAAEHLARAHSSTMRALPHVTKGDLDLIRRIGRAIEHAEENAKSHRGD